MAHVSIHATSQEKKPVRFFIRYWPNSPEPYYSVGVTAGGDEVVFYLSETQFSEFRPSLMDTPIEECGVT